MCRSQGLTSLLCEAASLVGSIDGCLPALIPYHLDVESEQDSAELVAQTDPNQLLTYRSVCSRDACQNRVSHDVEQVRVVELLLSLGKGRFRTDADATGTDRERDAPPITLPSGCREAITKRENGGLADLHEVLYSQGNHSSEMICRLCGQAVPHVRLAAHPRGNSCRLSAEPVSKRKPNSLWRCPLCERDSAHEKLHRHKKHRICREGILARIRHLPPDSHRNEPSVRRILEVYCRTYPGQTLEDCGDYQEGKPERITTENVFQAMSHGRFLCRICSKTISDIERSQHLLSADCSHAIILRPDEVSHNFVACPLCSKRVSKQGVWAHKGSSGCRSTAKAKGIALDAIVGRSSELSRLCSLCPSCDREFPTKYLRHHYTNNTRCYKHAIAHGLKVYRRHERFRCQCGSEILNPKVHYRSKRHQNWAESTADDGTHGEVTAMPSREEVPLLI